MLVSAPLVLIEVAAVALALVMLDPIVHAPIALSLLDVLGIEYVNLVSTVGTCGVLKSRQPHVPPTLFFVPAHVATFCCVSDTDVPRI